MDTAFLRKTNLFRGMTEEEILSALSSFHAQEKRCKKGQALLHAGDLTEKLGLVLEGSVTVESNDAWGNRTILSHVGNKQFFAETYALLEDETLLVDVRANENCRILFFRIGSLKKLRSSNELWAMKFICNMLEISAHKNVVLSGRSFHISSRTIRERILSYLNTVSLQKHSTEFDIPFDRQQLADYLNVDRSALSNELSKLQREGVISCRKNHFELLSH